MRIVVSRRDSVRILGAAGIATLTGGCVKAQSDEAAANVLIGVRLEPFVDPLPVRAVLRPDSTTVDSEHYRLTMSEFPQKLHRDLPPTIVWGFAGITPGPTIHARRGRAITIDWVNRLPARHRLRVDHTLDGAGKDVPEVRTTIHLHGGHVGSKSDGYPEDWVTPGQVQHTVYPNRQPGATLWYHDHAMGITRLNAMMGLAGMYILHDPEEERLGLPSGRYEIPLVLQDRILDVRGQLAYPIGPMTESPWAPEFFGTQVLVNGKVTPYLDVEPRPYRFRLLNASNSRVFQMALTPGQPVIQIGADGGLLRAPVSRDELVIAPGERLDVIIDFRGRDGRRLVLVNYGRAPYPSGAGPVPGMVVQFRVRRPLAESGTSSEFPATLGDVPRLEERTAVRTRRHTLVEEMGSDQRLHRTLLNGKRFMDPITEDPANGSTEIWEFLNTTVDTHPIHLHTVHFQVLDRRVFDLRRYLRTSEVVFSGRLVEAPPEERGWKDTVICPPGQLTRIIVPFSGEPGRYVWHCHMLEHEDNEMMRPFVLTA